MGCRRTFLRSCRPRAKQAKSGRMRPTNLTNTYAYTKASASRLILPHLEPDGVPDRARTASGARDTSILLELQQREHDRDSTRRRERYLPGAWREMIISVATRNVQTPEAGPRRGRLVPTGNYRATSLSKFLVLRGPTLTLALGRRSDSLRRDAEPNPVATVRGGMLSHPRSMLLRALSRAPLRLAGPELQDN